MRQVARTCLDNRIFERISGIYLPTITWSIIELDYPYFIYQNLEFLRIERNVDYDSFNDVDDILLGLQKVVVYNFYENFLISLKKIAIVVQIFTRKK